MKCLKPNTIYNRYLKKYVTVPCGKCDACLIQKQNILAMRCSNECMQHVVNIFFTLTYTNNYIPVMQKHSNIVWLRRRVEKKHRIFKNGAYNKFVSFSDVYDYVDKSKYCDSFINNLNCFDKKNDIDNISDGGYTGVVSYRDINLYIKKLRYEISKTEFRSEKLRYVIIGEYGGKFNRPHYHGIFHTNNIEFGKWLYENIVILWRMADITSMSKKNAYGKDGLPKYVDASSVCSYVTKYISLYNSSSDKNKQFPVKPFIIFSKVPYYGLSKYDKNLVEEVYVNDNPSFERVVKQGNNFISVKSSLSLENRLWYRFDGIDRYSDEELCSIAFSNQQFPYTPKGRFARNVIKRCREYVKGITEVTYAALLQYIRAVRRFIGKLKSFYLIDSMSKSLDVDYLIKKINTWSDALVIKNDTGLNKKYRFLHVIYNKILDVGLSLDDEIILNLSFKLWYYDRYQQCLLHDYRSKYRKDLLGKHMSNLKF